MIFLSLLFFKEDHKKMSSNYPDIFLSKSMFSRSKRLDIKKRFLALPAAVVQAEAEKISAVLMKLFVI